ncbi:MAG: HEAT repeat domain-containing protein, partial [Planctomycetota bacterium]
MTGAGQEIEILQRELKTDPENPQLLLKLANLFERLEKWKEANTYWERATHFSRTSAPEIYAQIKKWNQIKDLLKDLSDHNPVIRRSAADTLGCLKDTRCLYKLVPLLTDLECQWNISQAIKSIYSPLAGPYLKELIHHKEHRVRSEAIKVIGHLQLQEYVEELLLCLQDEHFTVIKEAAIVLGNFQIPEAVPPLISLLDQSNLSVRHAAIDSLGKLKDSRSIAPLLKLVHKNTPSQIFTLKALSQFGEVVAPQILLLLKHSESEIREQASQTISQIKTPDMMEMVCQLLNHSEGAVRL